MNSQSFESWAIVELFGHQIIAGKVTDAVIGGQSFIRVDVPSANSTEAYTKFYGGGAIYAITPTDEATARAAAVGLNAKPVEVWKLHIAFPAASGVRTLPYEDDDLERWKGDRPC